MEIGRGVKSWDVLSVVIFLKNMVFWELQRSCIAGARNEPAYGAPYPMEPKQEINMLKAEADAMKNDLNEINRRIQDLEKDSSG